jgi:hypothetical protein
MYHDLVTSAVAAEIDFPAEHVEAILTQVTFPDLLAIERPKERVRFPERHMP